MFKVERTYTCEMETEGSSETLIMFYRVKRFIYIEDGDNRLLKIINNVSLYIGESSTL
jgi:hypothetical protein